MPSFSTILAALSLTSAVIASPVEKRKGFTVEQVAHGTFAKNGPDALIKTYRRHKKAVPDWLIKAAKNGPTGSIFAATSNGSVEAHPADEYDSHYLCPVSIGSAGTVLNMTIDTGSADLWVFSSLQSSSELDGHEYYNVDSPKIIQGASWNITYLDGSGASGQVYAEKVVIGGVTATRQAVEAAATISSDFSSDTDGIVGLGFSSINFVRPQKELTFFDTVKDSLPLPLFAVNLKHQAPGTYDFGFIDSSKYTGSITYVDVDSSEGYWGLTASGYAVGNGSTSMTSIDGIADTGTTFLMLPPDIVRTYYAEVTGAQEDNEVGGYVFPCSATLPDLYVIINGAKLRVPGQYMNYAPFLTRPTICFGALQTFGDDSFNIFGDVFLKAQYVIFENDGERPRLGFAPQAGL